MINSYKKYVHSLTHALDAFDWTRLEVLEEAMYQAWQQGKQIFVCGNGGSAGNAGHWANDFIYPVCKTGGRGMKIHALTANPSVVTCLANDLGYEKVFSYQLATFAEAGDLVIVLSGSGNSANIIEVLKQAQKMQVKSFALVGFDGGKSLHLADEVLHFALNDMQVVEDIQEIVCHMLMVSLQERLA